EPAALSIPVKLVVQPAAATVAPAAARPAARVPAPSGPVAAWAFEERRGNVVRDVTGHGHDGLVHGALRRAGRYGGGLQFDGIDDWVTVRDASALRLRPTLTLEAWVRPAADGSGRRSLIVKQ